MRRILMLTIAATMLVPVVAQGQTRRPAPKPATKPAAIVQKVIPPKAVYWLSAQTMTGFGMAGLGGGNMPSPGDMMRMAMSGQQPGAMAKSLSLDLGGKLPVSTPPPLARHLIPLGMNMGDLLFLKSPQRAAATPSEPEDYEPPKGRVLLFWGCGETARPGQPVVIDFAKMAAGQVPPGLFAGERVRIARPPSYAGWPNHGHWPNDDRASRTGVPANASLIGDHAVRGNYIPEIDFSLTRDFMGALTLDQKKAPSGAIAMSWNQLPDATGHFASFMGGEGDDPAKGATLVFWSSSESQTFISALGDYIAPTEAARLVGTKQLMPPTQTDCAIPKEVMAAAPNGLVSLVAHGPEENFLFPPRPADPKITWDQQYAVKARFVARAGGPAGMNMAEMMGDDEDDRPRRSGKRGTRPKCAPGAGDAVGGMIGGLLGGRRKKEDCDPS
jgi:hypothetical protein